MRKLGYFLHKSPSGRIIVRITDRVPRIGSRVVNSQGKTIGVLIDVIGPVKRPYAVIKPFEDEIKVRESEVLYVR